jgi:hypothetical protein
MTIISRGLGIIAIAAAVSLAGSPGGASIARPEDQDHRSLLRARITLANGTDRTVTLEGVGCNVGMCSRVAIRNTTAGTVWLDSLASVTDITAGNSFGPVKLIFRFKNGADREALVTSWNRVLYLQGRFGFTRKLDLGGVETIDFTD